MAGGFGSVPRDIVEGLGKKKDMFELKIPDALIDKKPLSPCKGLFVRARINNFVSDGRIGFHIDFTLLKKLSCADDHDPGNGFQCDRVWMLDSVNEWGANLFKLPEGGVEHEAIYQVVCKTINEEEFELHFKKVES